MTNSLQFFFTPHIFFFSPPTGQSYEWNPEFAGQEMAGKRVIGLIAQEVQKVLPEVVQKDETTGFLSVSYVEILPVLIDAFNSFLLEYKQDKSDLNMQVENLKTQVHELSENLAQSMYIFYLRLEIIFDENLFQIFLMRICFKKNFSRTIFFFIVNLLQFFYPPQVGNIFL